MMKHKLVHKQFRADGIFGEFYFEGSTTPFMVTVEHAYQQDDGSYLPKIYDGTFHCVRGTHELHNGIPFETFEVTGVEGHSGILCCHVGNYNKDSDGCILGGEKVVAVGGIQGVSNSMATFHSYMAELHGVSEFDLEVTSESV